jgi:molecular chaperone GrpE
MPHLQADTGEDDEIEILEVIGLDEDSPAAGAGVASDDDDGEITLEFDETGNRSSGGTISADTVGHGRAQSVSEREMLGRLQADFENFKKRVERERLANQRQAAAALVSRILPVLDNFERAISSEIPSDEGRAFHDGVALIFRQLLEELRREGLTSVDSLGQEFDPNLHEAVATDHVPGLPGNTVVEEMRRGYLLHGRLLRPAQVKVSLDEAEMRAQENGEG